MCTSIKNIDIPIFITLFNDTELNIYKNKIFLSLFKKYLLNFSIYKNCVFIYSGNENKELIKNNHIENSYEIKTFEISKNNSFKAIYEYLEFVNFNYDWYINLEMARFSEDTIYQCITNINDNYDFITFSRHQLDINQYIIDEKNNKFINKLVYQDNIVKTIDTNIFIVKTKWFIDCCQKSNFDPLLFGHYFWQGKYILLDNLEHFELNLNTKEQVDNFLKMIQEIKNEKS